MTLYNLVKKYADMGFVCIPVDGESKRPILNSWKEYQSKRPTDKDLKDWFPDEKTGVALICGKLSGVAVVDLDTYKKESGIILETPVKVITGGGGLHGYFKYSDNITNSVNENLAVDIKSEGGYVILPPTIHKSGNQYKWQLDGKLDELIKNLPELPRELFEKIKKNPSAERISIDEAIGLKNGEGRNDTFYKLACSFIARDGEALAWLAISELNKTGDRLSDFELKTLFNSALNFIKTANKNKSRFSSQDQSLDSSKELQKVSENTVRRFFHPALTIDQNNQEVLVGIPVAKPTFENGKYKLNETIWIISSKGEKWPLIPEQMESRNIYPKSIPSFGVTEPRWSPDFMVTTDSEAKTDQGYHSDYNLGGQVDPYQDIFAPTKQTLERFIDFNNPNHSTLITLWVIGTYIFPIFEAYPYLDVGGTKDSGKSKILDIIYRLAFNPIFTSNASPSSLFRTIENTLATILLDEGELLTGREPNPDIRLLFNAGYKSTGIVTRTNTDNFKVEQFRVYSPKAIAAINQLEPTLASRCIPIIMLRTANKEKGASKVNDRSADWKGMRDKLYRFTLQHALKVAELFDSPEIETNLNNRNFELFSPLIAISTYIDKFTGEEQKISPLVLAMAEELVMEADQLDDWTLWTIQALDTIVTDFRSYLVKEIRNAIKEARKAEEEYLDDKLSNKWIGACLRRLGFKRGKPTNQGKTYFIKRQQIESLKERYELNPIPSNSTSTKDTMVTNEAKAEDDHKTSVTPVSGNGTETPITLEEAVDGLPF